MEGAVDLSQLKQSERETSERLEVPGDFNRAELDRILEKNPRDSEALIKFFEKKYAETYAADADVREKYSIREHTLMVLEQFNKYFGDKNLPGYIDPNFFRVVLALHDIGKPQATAAGDKFRQHEFTTVEMRETLMELGYSRCLVDIAVALVSGDYIGECLKAKSYEAEEKRKRSANNIVMVSSDLDIDAQQLFGLMKVLFQVDAGSYTEDAGGKYPDKPSLGYLFDFKPAEKTMDFSSSSRLVVGQLEWGVQVKANEFLANRQKELNEMFPLENRDRLAASASLDAKGRPVRYYREMGWEYLQILLKKGSLTAYDYFQNAQETGDDHYAALDGHIDRTELLILLSDYAWNLGREDDVSLEIEDEGEIERLFREFFPQGDPNEIKRIMKEPTYGKLLPFLEKNLPIEKQRTMHTGSAHMKFSTLLSFSVGGPVYDHLRKGRVMVEFIVPDVEVIDHPDRSEGEKEVFIKKVKRDQIARVWINNEQLFEEVLTNPDIPVGDYYQNVFPNREEGDNRSLHESWRWDEPTEDCLSVGLKKKDEKSS